MDTKRRLSYLLQLRDILQDIVAFGEEHGVPESLKVLLVARTRALVAQLRPEIEKEIN